MASPGESVVKIDMLAIERSTEEIIRSRHPYYVAYPLNAGEVARKVRNASSHRNAEHRATDTYRSEDRSGFT